MICTTLFPEKRSDFSLNAISSADKSTLYAIACAIFRELALCFQYALVLASTTFKHLPFFSSAIPRKYVALSSRNIAKVSLLPGCFAKAWNPLPKKVFEHIGRSAGLRITTDIIDNPSSGLCLGLSLTFLRDALDITNRLPEETPLRLQNIYDALMGMEGKVSQGELDLFVKLMTGGSIHERAFEQKELLKSVQNFLAEGNFTTVFREFIFNDLDNRGVDINPNIYALTLELDIRCHQLKCPQEKKCASIHHAIMQTIANCIELKLEQGSHFHGNVSKVSQKIQNLPVGNYLIQFLNHTVAYVVTQDQMIALYEPNEGLALLTQENQQLVLLQFLEFYGIDHEVSLRIIPVTHLKK